MSNFTRHTIRLQDGNLCNLNRRLGNRAVSLHSLLETIPDPRKLSGRRHALSTILLIVFVALLRGSKDLKDAHLFATLNQRFFRTQLGLSMPHGIPDPTTISRLLGRLEPDDLVRMYLRFLNTLGVAPSDVMSYDGKTMCAVSGEAATRHILSFFSHDSHLALGQVGVNGRGRRSTGVRRSARTDSANDLVHCSFLLSDALPHPEGAIEATLQGGTDYLFIIKERRRQVEDDRSSLNQHMQKKTASTGSSTRVRNEGEEFTLHKPLFSMPHSSPPGNISYAATLPTRWDRVAAVSKLHRTGTSLGKNGPVHEMVETISSQHWHVVRFQSGQDITASPKKAFMDCSKIRPPTEQKMSLVLEAAPTLQQGNCPHRSSTDSGLCVLVLCRFPQAQFRLGHYPHCGEESRAAGTIPEMAAAM